MIELQARVNGHPSLLDFRVGGREFNHGRDLSGRTHTFDSRFHEIVPERRIVFAYDMHLDGEHGTGALLDRLAGVVAK